MKHGSLICAKSNCVIKNVNKTTNFFERMRGLLGRRKLNIDEGLLITSCPSVHTFGMRFTIDIVFLDKDLIIVKTVKSLNPWRIAASNNAYMALELADNSINRLQLTTGQQLEWHDESIN